VRNNIKANLLEIAMQRGIRLMKRSRDMIISKILDICSGGAHKTKIVHEASINFRIVNPYIELLTKNGMINPKTNGRLVIYETTARGFALLNNCKQVQEDLNK
jgi:predicted transcriptional regulator